MRLCTILASLLLAGLLHFYAHAVTIETSRHALVVNGPISSSARGRNLESELRDKVFNPLGIDFEVAAQTGGTSAVDDMAFEGNKLTDVGAGLTIITGSGFLLNFDSPMSQVRMQVSNFKDQGNRSLYAFDSNVSYVRDPNTTSQHTLGNVTSLPNLAQAIDSVTIGPLPTGMNDLFDMTVTGNIRSVLLTSDRFLWTLTEIEVIPEPATFGLAAPVLLLLGLIGRRRRRPK